MSILWIIGCVFAGIITGFILGIYVQATRPMDFYGETCEEFNEQFDNKYRSIH